MAHVSRSGYILMLRGRPRVSICGKVDSPSLCVDTVIIVEYAINDTLNVASRGGDERGGYRRLIPCVARRLVLLPTLPL